MADRRWTTADFDYPLPEDLIAQSPSRQRGESRLLVVEREAGREPAAAAQTRRPISPHPDTSAAAHAPRQPIRDLAFPALLDLIPAGDLVVLNTTKVRHARLLGTRPGGGPAEVLLLHPAGDDTWLAMGKPGRALQPGKRVLLDDAVSI